MLSRQAIGCLQCGHVERGVAPVGVVRVERAHDEHDVGRVARIVGPTARASVQSLGETNQRVVVDVVELEVAQAAERRVGAAYFVEPSQERRQRTPFGFGLLPAGKRFRHGIEKDHAPPHVGGDDRIANAGQSDLQPLPLLPQRLVRPLALRYVSEDDH